MELSKTEGFTHLKNQIKLNLIININKNENLKRRDLIVDKISSLLFREYSINYTLTEVNSSDSESYYLKSKFAEYKNDKIKIKNLFLFIEVYKYLKTFTSILKNLNSRSEISHKNRYLLVYSLTDEQVINKAQNSCVNFLSTFFSKIKFNHILVETKLNIVNCKNVQFHSKIIDYFIKEHSRNIKFKLIRVLYRDLRCVLKNVTSDTKNIIGSGDFLEGKILNCILQTKKIDVTCLSTQTKLVCNPGIFYFSKKINNKILWYSDNSLPILPKGNTSSIDLSYFRTNYIGEHLVFSKTFSKVLSRYNKNCVKVILPFSFNNEYPLKFNRSQVNDFSSIKKSHKVIAYFPVMPQKIVSQVNFYSLETMSTDLKALKQAIIQSTAAHPNKYVLFIKPKRKFSKYHLDSYKKLLFESNTKVSSVILNPQEDLLKILKYSDLVICTPFTSVGSVAKFLGKKVVFFSITNNFDLPRNYNGIRIINSAKTLSQFINAI